MARGKYPNSNNGDRIIHDYLKDVGRHSVMDKEEEYDLGVSLKQHREMIEQLRELIKKAETSEEQADLHKSLAEEQKEYEENFERLFLANLRLVVHIAKQYRGRGMSFTDLIQEGNLGLRHAITKYEVDLTFRLGGYASWWIRQNIGRALADKGRTVRLPVHVKEMINQISKFQRIHKSLHGHAPSSEEIAEELGIKHKRINQVLGYMQLRDFEIDMPMDDEGDLCYRDLLSDESAHDPVEEIERRQNAELLEQLMGSLNANQRFVIRKRYGLNDDSRESDGLTLEQVGKEMGRTRERVRQIQDRAEKIMRNRAANKVVPEDF